MADAVEKMPEDAARHEKVAFSIGTEVICKRSVSVERSGC
jgi:hypothetical protein